MSVLGFLGGLGLIVAAGWTGLQVRSMSEDRRAFLAATGFFAALGISALILSSSASSVPVLRLLANLLGAAAFCFMTVWFVHAISDRPPRWLVTAQLCLLSGEIIVVSLIWLSNPTQIQHGLGGGSGPRGASAVAFALVVGFYLAVTQAQAVVMAVLYSAQPGSAASRAGFCILAAGLGLQVMQTGGKAVAVAISVIGHGWTPGLLRFYLGVIPLRPPSFMIMLVGAVCSGVASLAAGLPAWRANRRRYLTLQPLRRLLYENFPEHALGTIPSIWRDVLLPRRVHWRFYRCVVEILDGLDQLRPFYNQAIADAAIHSGRSGDDVLARVLWEATQAHIGIITAALREATYERLIGDEIDEAIHQALVDNAAQRHGEPMFHGFDHVGDGTMEQVTLRLTRLTDALVRLAPQARSHPSDGPLTPLGR